jgi:hypothetical protein
LYKNIKDEELVWEVWEAVESVPCSRTTTAAAP